MSCFNPVKAYQSLTGGPLFFGAQPPNSRPLYVSCGGCIGCRLSRSSQWALRCFHEMQLHRDNNCFITLTYSDSNLPTDLSLDHKDFQDFFKRLRKRYRIRSNTAKIRYYMCGEYGEKFERPHFHAILFGHNFKDRVPFFKTDSGCVVDRSKELESLWTLGHSTVADATMETAAYVSRYVMKKVTGKAADRHYQVVDYATGEIKDREPEYNRMSLKPGIGLNWLEKYESDVFPRDFIVREAKKYPVPRYYSKMRSAAPRWSGTHSSFHARLLHKQMLDEDNHYVVYLRGLHHSVEENTPERLAVREAVMDARISQLKRKIL